MAAKSKGSKNAVAEHVPHVSRVQAVDPDQNKHVPLEKRTQPVASRVQAAEEAK